MKGGCPGFGQDRVNFHRNPGRGTAGGWGLTPPGQTEPGIPYHVTSRGVPVGGAARREGTCGLGGRSVGPVSGERLSVRFVVVLSPYLYRCCFCFPSVCCSVELPLSQPTSFCLFLFILLRTPAGGGVAAWCFCCRRQPKPEHIFINIFVAYLT